jgi:hypothetical protein
VLSGSCSDEPAVSMNRPSHLPDLCLGLLGVRQAPTLCGGPAMPKGPRTPCPPAGELQHRLTGPVGPSGEAPLRSFGQAEIGLDWADCFRPIPAKPSRQSVKPFFRCSSILISRFLEFRCSVLQAICCVGLLLF